MPATKSTSDANNPVGQQRRSIISNLANAGDLFVGVSIDAPRRGSASVLYRPRHLRAAEAIETELCEISSPHSIYNIIRLSLEIFLFSCAVAILTSPLLAFHTFARYPCPKCELRCCLSNHESYKLAQMLLGCLSGFFLHLFMISIYGFVFDWKATSKAFRCSFVFSCIDLIIRVPDVSPAHWIPCHFIFPLPVYL